MKFAEEAPRHAGRAQQIAGLTADRAKRLCMAERIELTTSVINREITVDQASCQSGASAEQVSEWVRRHGGDRIIRLSELKPSRAMPPELLARCNQLVALERCLAQLHRERLLFECLLKERLRQSLAQRPPERRAGGFPKK